MPSILNVCTQPLDEQGQAKSCPCRYTRKCPDSTVKCDYGERYCKNCYTDENGKFHHEPAKLKDGTFFPCNNFAPFPVTAISALSTTNVRSILRFWASIARLSKEQTEIRTVIYPFEV